VNNTGVDITATVKRVGSEIIKATDFTKEKNRTTSLQPEQSTDHSIILLIVAPCSV